MMSADQNGIHAGRGMTGTPYAYGSFDASGNRLSGSTNITCPWQSNWSTPGYYCTLAGITSYSSSQYLAVVTADEWATPLTNVAYVYSVGIAVGFFTSSGAATQTPFSIVVFKP